MSRTEVVELTAAVSGFHRVGSLTELHAGRPLRAVVEGKSVAVFAVDEGCYATTGVCPHAGGPLHEGDMEGKYLSCPWHGLTFDVTSGTCNDDPALSLETYEVRVVGDDILVRI